MAEFFDFIESRAAEFQGLIGPDGLGRAEDGVAGESEEAGLPGGGELDHAWREHLARQARQVAQRLGGGGRPGEGEATPPLITAEESLEVEEGLEDGSAAAEQQEEPAPEPKEWETAEGQKAVQALQSMGAKVYLPGGKDDLDWGVLAG